jgi:hypothetical protein
MDLDVYIREVKNQARFVELAWECLHNNRGKDEDKTWYSVQALLGAAANLSKLFNPPKPGIGSKEEKEIAYEFAKRRAEELRKAFGVDEQFELLDRDVRNHFEHFDYRLDLWTRENPGPPNAFVDRLSPQPDQPFGRITHVNDKPTMQLRELDIPWKATCLGSEIDVEKVVSEVKKLKVRAEELLIPTPKPE